MTVLAGAKRLPTATGRATFAVLIAQDLAVVPIPLHRRNIGAGRRFRRLRLIGGTCQGYRRDPGNRRRRPARAAAAVPDCGGYRQRRTFHGNDVVCRGRHRRRRGLGGSVDGVLGGFVAGLLLAETEYRRAIEATIEPFKGLLLGVFFFSVGMGFDGMTLVRAPLLIISMTLGLVLVKSRHHRRLVAAIRTVVVDGDQKRLADRSLWRVRLYRYRPVRDGRPSRRDSDRTDPGSRCSLDGGGAGLRLSRASPGRRASRKLSRLIRRTLVAPPPDEAVRAIVVGYGRVGELVAKMLERHAQAYIAIDRSSATVALARRKNRPVYFGDCANPAFLKTCGIDLATAVINTVDAPAMVDEIVKAVRAMRNDIVIVARARDSNHARHLYEIGVTDAVPETIEASLQLSEAALVGLGVPMGPVIASVHEQRDEIRKVADPCGRQFDHASERSRKGMTSGASRKLKG